MKYYVVLDTNVVVSALFNISSVPGIILQETLAGRVIPLLHEDSRAHRPTVPFGPGQPSHWSARKPQ